jgi:hypothetical protein
MQTYSQLFSILNKDGKKYLVDLYSWAEMTLTGSRLAQYTVDSEEFNAHYLNYVNSGEFSVQPIYSSVEADNSRVPIQIQTRMTWQTALDQHPKLDYWLQEFASDPNVEYQPLIRET